mgnify:CR=1 FL=1
MLARTLYISGAKCKRRNMTYMWQVRQAWVVSRRDCILAKDILADGAEAYVNLPLEERGAFLDDWIAQWTRLGERMARGEEREAHGQRKAREQRPDRKSGRRRSTPHARSDDRE